MPRNLSELSDNERKALLNHVWNTMVSHETAVLAGSNAGLSSPLGQAGPVPHDLADHLKPFVGAAGGAGLASDWKILNASCALPNDVAARLGGGGGGGIAGGNR